MRKIGGENSRDTVPKRRQYRIEEVVYIFVRNFPKIIWQIYFEFLSVTHIVNDDGWAVVDNR